MADSLYSLINLGEDFIVLAEKYSLSNPQEGGLIIPFSREKNNSFFDAAFSLDLGEITPVLSAPGNKFSILRLEKVLPKEPKSFFSVYVRIESLLIKEEQNRIKEDAFRGLQKKFYLIIQ